MTGPRCLHPGVHALDVGVDLGLAGDNSVDVPPDDRPEVVHRHEIVRPRHCYDRGAVLPADCECVLTAGGLLGQQRRRCGIERVAVKVHIFEADLFREGTRLRDLRLGG